MGVCVAHSVINPKSKEFWHFTHIKKILLMKKKKNVFFKALNTNTQKTYIFFKGIEMIYQFSRSHFFSRKKFGLWTIGTSRTYATETLWMTTGFFIDTFNATVHRASQLVSCNEMHVVGPSISLHCQHDT